MSTVQKKDDSFVVLGKDALFIKNTEHLVRHKWHIVVKKGEMKCLCGNNVGHVHCAGQSMQKSGVCANCLKEAKKQKIAVVQRNEPFSVALFDDDSFSSLGSMIRKGDDHNKNVRTPPTTMNPNLLGHLVGQETEVATSINELNGFDILGELLEEEGLVRCPTSEKSAWKCLADSLKENKESILRTRFLAKSVIGVVVQEWMKKVDTKNDLDCARKIKKLSKIILGEVNF